MPYYIYRVAQLGPVKQLEKLTQFAAFKDASARAKVAMVEAGIAATTDDAFERWLGRGRPGFVPRIGAAPDEVIARLHAAGGFVSLAHPGLTRVDAAIPGFVEAGLDALEAYHSRHDAETTARYVQLARSMDLLVTGGSDFHGDPSHGPLAPGTVTLPADEFARVQARRRATSRAMASGPDTSS